MKLTESQLRQIIREELMNEKFDGRSLNHLIRPYLDSLDGAANETHNLEQELKRIADNPKEAATWSDLGKIVELVAHHRKMIDALKSGIDKEAKWIKGKLK